jgi:hypothetical protein
MIARFQNQWYEFIIFTLKNKEGLSHMRMP